MELRNIVHGLGMAIIVGAAIGCAAAVPTVAPARPAASAPAPAPAVAAAPSSGAIARDSAFENKGGSFAFAPPPGAESVIRSGTLTITTSDVETSVRESRQLATRYGGSMIAVSSREEREKDAVRSIATVTVRVPTEQFDSLVSDLRQFGDRVESE